MDPKQALETLKGMDEVPSEVIEALEASPLRKQLAEWEAKWRDEAEPAIAFKATQETLPKRKEAVKKAGIDYDSQPLYAQEVLDAIPADKLDNGEYVASYIQQKGFTATKQAEGGTEQPKAAAIVEHATNAGTTPDQETYEAAIEAASSPEELDAVYKRFGKEPVSS